MMEKRIKSSYRSEIERCLVWKGFDTLNLMISYTLNIISHRSPKRWQETNKFRPICLSSHRVQLIRRGTLSSVIRILRKLMRIFLSFHFKFLTYLLIPCSHIVEDIDILPSKVIMHRMTVSSEFLNCEQVIFNCQRFCLLILIFVIGIHCHSAKGSYHESVHPRLIVTKIRKTTTKWRSSKTLQHILCCRIVLQK